MALTLTPIPGIPLIYPGDDLGEIIYKKTIESHLEPKPGDIWVIAQKIVSKSENRIINIQTIVPSARAFEIANKTLKDPRFVELVLRESKTVLRQKPGALIVEHKNGFICANAGIDHSNVESSQENPEDWVLLLPEDADKSAQYIRAKLENLFKMPFGVLIIDSHGRAWRNGTVGTSIGLSGLPAVVDLRGKPDLFGFKLKITQVGAADELAAAASLVMGQADESQPVILASGFPYQLREGSMKELIRDEKEDLFR
ncbi:coenzyme F420-0:L-glutamate ligase [Leptolinea tardivitalis]|uniref:F420-0--gamma-glutamyl ligase n=1 Tax=Leptolinea tardivitalis TaxID=229920 RepID=A0A0P6X1C1_9CHLR|nr:coenzyme F420-0:L-glutamate ligase [Leptolinea tardivitalis]KPL74693.1 F420-0--gamma-glutamyl ligase [Leptolinea tardivitalis]GAP22956.1 coenzyme F420-0 gamma-glutamyl ligase [Leptolinea tardivitalis]